VTVSEADGAETARQRTPAGIVLLCLVLVLYSLLWFLSATLGSGPTAALSITVAVGVLVLVYLLYTGSTAGWWLGLLFLGGSTLWRFSLVAHGHVENLLNALVGLGILAYLLSQSAFYRPLSAGR